MVDKEKSVRVIDNLEIHADHVTVSVNPKIYSLDVVYSASYVLMDKAYIVINGDPEEEIVVEIRPKKGEVSEKLGRDFNNELINYAVYRSQAEVNKGVKEAIVARALMTNAGEIPEVKAEAKIEEQSYIDDPEGIAIPWEEKYGKDE